jgi:cell division protein FtsW (lipid II flippase)
MALRDLFRRPARAEAAGPVGVGIDLRAHNRPSAERSGRNLPGLLWWGLLLGVVFYVLAHLSIAMDVWPVHGTSTGAGASFIRDMASLAAWLLLLFMMKRVGYRGSWPVIVLPIIIFCMVRPSVFQLFTDPSYQAAAGRKAEANDLKATRSRLSTIERAYSDERKLAVFQGPPPPLPDPFTKAMEGQARGALIPRVLTYLPVFFAPLAVLVGFLISRRGWLFRWLRDRRLWIFAPAMLLFFGLAFVPGARSTGKVFGTTPWELLLPLFIGIWAATLADDAYNLGQMGQAFHPKRILRLVLYGAIPLIPFLLIHELGLSVVMAGSMAAMLLVGTRRGWWAGLMLGLWAVLVFAAFSVDPRSIQRLNLAYQPYQDLESLPEQQAQRWGERANFQIKLFDANILEGGLLGEGAGRGHAETAPNAADDGYITTIAAQWGLAGAVALVLVYTYFIMQMLGVAVREPGAFERTLATGLALLIGIPFWLATLGGVRVIPLTGVVAAFAAHGGSKLLAASISVGIIAGLSHRRTEEERLEHALATPLESGETAATGVRIV